MPLRAGADTAYRGDLSWADLRLSGYRDAWRGNLDDKAVMVERLREVERGLLDLVLRQEHELRRVAERHERVLARDARHAAVEAGVDERGHDALRDPAGAARLVGDEDPARLGRLAQQVLDRERRQPPEVDDARVHAV